MRAEGSLPDQPLYRVGTFHLDDDGPFPGYTIGVSWNGFATPAFTREIADQVAAAIGGNYVEERDVYVFPGDDPDGYEGFDTATPDGPRRLYAIGAFAWCWHEDKRP
jgi:hypothetical protein